jgi:tRNA A-37 threonylcarbamoyl transferase component Bud32
MGTAPPPFREPLFKPDDVLEGRYRIIKVIGEGGMGTVYLAEHVLIKRRVAIKVLHPEYTTDADVIERFMNEARAAGTLGHPNIVESTDMGFGRDHTPYIVFEYLEGSPLSDEVYRLGGLNIRRALRITHQIASALDAAHAAGIVHRDLKSDNVILTHRDEVADHVKVIDFGISRFTEGESTTGAGGRRGTVMGTPEFMAPEQMTAPEGVDHRADIYALGVVLYEMLAGRTPWVNNNDTEALVHQILLEAPPAIDRKEIPPGLNELIFERLLAKEPDKRFQTMKDVKAAIEAFWGASRRDSQPIEPIEIPAPAPAPAPVPAEAIALPRLPPRRSPLPVIALVLAILVGGAGGYLFVQAGKRTAKPDATAAAALDTDATNIAAAIDAVAKEVQFRAQSVATTPVLRAAIETDPATMQDLVRDGALARPAADDVMEVVQVRNGKRTPMVRVPMTAPELSDPGAATAADVSDGKLRIVSGAPVTGNSNAEGGAVWISAPVDLQAIESKLHEHALAARIEGFKTPILLVPPTKQDGEQVTRVIAPQALKGTKIALVATIARVTPPDTYTLPAYGCFGAAGLLLLVFVVGMMLQMKRARGNQ